MQILSTGGTMSAIEEQPEATSTLERYSPKELAGFLNAFWDDQAHRPIPTDIRWEDYAPEKVMLRFKDELKRLQPYVEGWFSERGKSLPDWPKNYFVPVEGWIDYFKAHPDAARLPQGPMRDEWIASRVLYLSALCPWRYTQGVFRFAPSFAMLLEATSLEAFLKQRYEGWLTNPLRPEDEAAMHIKSVDHLALYRSEEVREAFYAHNVKLMRPILAMLLYLCTTEPDIVSNRKPGLKPANNEGRHVKKGFRLFPAEGPHIWNVGQSMENDMAKHYRVVHDESQSLLSGKKREVRSHVRSAHWHGYWKGRWPKAEEKDMREFIFHWIPPLLVRGSRDVEPVKRSAKAQSQSRLRP